MGGGKGEFFVCLSVTFISSHSFEVTDSPSEWMKKFSVDFCNIAGGLGLQNNGIFKRSFLWVL